MLKNSKKDHEIFTLPNGANIHPHDTHHVSFHKDISLSALGSDVHLGLETVFGSDFSISREDIEYLLHVLNPTGQKKALRGYFYKKLGDSGFKDLHHELSQKINSFPTENWTDQDWEVFGDLAPISISKKAKMNVGSSNKKLRNRYLPHDALFRSIVASYEGSYDSLDGRGHR